MKTKDFHPVYPNPTIIEAIIEIYLKNPVSSPDMDSLMTKFGKEYECKKDKIKVFTAAFSEKSFNVSQEETNQYRLQLRTSEQRLTQIFSNRFSVHWLGRYEGWKKFESEFTKVWSDFQSVLPKIQGQRIGVRFINRLEEKSITEPLKTWLKPSPNYPLNFLDSKTGFFYRGKWTVTNEKSAESRSFVITIAEGEANQESYKPLLFDIDIVEYCENHSNGKQIAGLASILHDEIWNIFSSSISTRYKKVLNKTQKS